MPFLNTAKSSLPWHSSSPIIPCYALNKYLHLTIILVILLYWSIKDDSAYIAFYRVSLLFPLTEPWILLQYSCHCLIKLEMLYVASLLSLIAKFPHMVLWLWVPKVNSLSHVTWSELFCWLFWHNSSVLEATYYAHNNSSIMTLWKSLPIIIILCTPQWGMLMDTCIVSQYQQ